MSEENNKPFDVFELLTAILLGLSAIGAAVAGFQNNQWGGKQLAAFAEANALTTKAAKDYNEGVSDINSDYAAVGEAKKMILEGLYAETQDDQDKAYMLATYYLLNQTTGEAYEALGLPADEAPDEEAAPTEMSEEEFESSMSEALAEEDLIQVLNVELHDNEAYFEDMLSEGSKQFAEADKKFQEGRQANDNGDRFDLASVFFAVALFFGGVGLVFKTTLRWGFFAMGVIAFLSSAIYLMTLPWA